MQAQALRGRVHQSSNAARGVAQFLLALVPAAGTLKPLSTLLVLMYIVPGTYMRAFVPALWRSETVEVVLSDRVSLNHPL